MPILADYHMHTPRCKHATGPMEAYIERGIELGLQEIGFADHNPLPRNLGANVRMTEPELDDYVADVLRLRDRYRGQIEVRLGLEVDYVPGLESYVAAQIARHPWDYLIGSVHYLDRECQFGSWPPKFTGDVGDLYRRYFALVGELARSGLCDIIAHFDIAKRSGQLPTEREAALITQTLNEIAAANLCIEINTSGYRHSELPNPEPYPSLPVAAQALALGIPLTVNSDAHSPGHVGTKFSEIEAWLRANGCQTLARFERRQREAYDLA